MYFLPFFFFSIKLHFFLYRRWNQTRLISVQLEEEKRSLSGKARSKPLAVITAIPSNELWGRHVKRSLSGHEARFQWKSCGPGVTYAGERERRRRRRRWRRQPRRYQLKPARAFSARGKSVAETEPLSVSRIELHLATHAPIHDRATYLFDRYTDEIDRYK